jgi:hypothetical protein
MIAWKDGEPDIKIGFKREFVKDTQDTPKKVRDNRISRINKGEIASDKSTDGDIMQRWCHRIVSAGASRTKGWEDQLVDVK